MMGDILVFSPSKRLTKQEILASIANLRTEELKAVIWNNRWVLRHEEQDSPSAEQKT